MKYENIITHQLDEIIDLVDNNVFDIAKQKTIHLIQLIENNKYTEDLNYYEKEYGIKIDKIENDMMNIIHDKEKTKNFNDVLLLLRESEHLSIETHREYFNTIISYTIKYLRVKA
jgi:hypothetical protein